MTETDRSGTRGEAHQAIVRVPVRSRRGWYNTAVRVQGNSPEELARAVRSLRAPETGRRR